MPGIAANEMHCVLEMYLLAHGISDPEIQCMDGGMVMKVDEETFKCNPGEEYLNLRGCKPCEMASIFMFNKCRKVTRCVHNIADKKDCIRALRQMIPICGGGSCTPECVKAIDNRLKTVEDTVIKRSECIKHMSCRLDAFEKTLNQVVDLLNKTQWNR
jgi:hypothetical protein